MRQYFIAKMLEEEYYTAEELAILVSNLYGIVNYRGREHCGFIRAILEVLRVRFGDPIILTDNTPRLFAYKNKQELLNFMERILPVLVEEKALSIPIEDINHPGKINNWRVFLKDELKFYKKRPLYREAKRVYPFY